MKTELPSALGSLKDWSTWLVSLQTGALGLVSFVTGKETGFKFNKCLLKTVICFFAASIIAATWVLAAIPSLALRIGDRQLSEAEFYHMDIFPTWPHIPLEYVTIAQHWLFLIGLGCFVAAALSKRHP